jgi:hypothetical protein
VLQPSVRLAGLVASVGAVPSWRQPQLTSRVRPEPTVMSLLPPFDARSFDGHHVGRTARLAAYLKLVGELADDLPLGSGRRTGQRGCESCLDQLGSDFAGTGRTLGRTPRRRG